MKIYLIRHGQTKGNLLGKYIGRKTDEELSEEGEALISSLRGKYDHLNNDETTIYSGPMKRALRTAQILFENKKINIVDDLTEIDFGDFENKNYKELNGNSDYQAFIDSGGKKDYPNGERQKDFINRSNECFNRIIKHMCESKTDKSAVVCHGGNIMAIMSSLSGKEYFDFQVENGRGFCMELNIEDGKAVNIVSYHSL